MQNPFGRFFFQLSGVISRLAAQNRDAARCQISPRKAPAPLDAERPRPYVPRHLFQGPPKRRQRAMKVVNSLKSMKDRHKECRIIRRKGRLYVINKRNPRFKARQG